MVKGMHFGLRCLPPEFLIRGDAIGGNDFQCFHLYRQPSPHCDCLPFVFF